ncbi:hypothetical protein EV363DRAFT_1412637 [Boletus edulis]|nr:hypothetical protein EV363DRAFT_1412637 [Boletus edulis]
MKTFIIGAPKSTPIGVPTSAPIGVPTSAPIGVPKSAPIDVPKSAPIGVPKSAPVDVPKSMPRGAPKSSSPGCSFKAGSGSESDIFIPNSLPASLLTARNICARLHTFPPPPIESTSPRNGSLWNGVSRVCPYRA